MASKISFTGAQLLSFGRDGKGGKAHFSSSLTSSVIKAMEWGEIPEFVTGTSLEGELAATELTIEPKDAELKKHAIALELRQVSKFQTVRLELEGKNGKGFRTELRFTASFGDLKGCRKLEEYMVTVGGKSTVMVSYEKQAVQESLIPDVEASDEERQAAMEIS